MGAFEEGIRKGFFAGMPGLCCLEETRGTYFSSVRLPSTLPEGHDPSDSSKMHMSGFFPPSLALKTSAALANGDFSDLFRAF